MTKTLEKLFKPIIKKRPVWDYKIISPTSFDDELKIHVILKFGSKKCDSIEEYTVNLLLQGIEIIKITEV